MKNKNNLNTEKFIMPEEWPSNGMQNGIQMQNINMLSFLARSKWYIIIHTFKTIHKFSIEYRKLFLLVRLPTNENKYAHVSPLSYLSLSPC